MSPPPQFCLPFGSTRVKQLQLQHPNDSASTATLTSMTSAATKLQFTEDTESYFQSSPAQTSPMPSRTASGGSVDKPKGLTRMLTWRRHDSTSPLVSDEPAFGKKTDEPTEILDTTSRLVALRKKMLEETIDYFIIPSEDGHLSEYVADSDKRVRYISGFTGSAATAIVSKRSAYLFVDSRYWIQAEQELDGNWTVHKTGTPEIKDWLDWAITCPRGSKIAIDSRMISHERATKLYKGLCERGSKLAHPRQNLVDLIWDDRPQRPKNPVFVQPVEFTGKDIKEKLSDVRRWIRKQNAAIGKDKGVTRHASNASQSKPGATPPKETIKRSNTSPNGASGKLSSTPPPQPPSAVPARMNNPGVKRSNSSPSAAAGPSGADKISAVFVSDLASIAYTLNLRGSDILYNPVFTAYLLIGVEGKTTLFIDKVKVPTEVRDYLHENGVSIREYSDVWTFLRAKQWGDGKVVINPDTPYAVSLIIGSSRYSVLPSYIEEIKAVKNDVEVSGMRAAYIRDGVALVRWFAWLDQKFSQGYEITEWEASEKLTNFRDDELRAPGAPKMFQGPAYENIVASGANAALPHYAPSQGGSKMISRDEPFLVDSGGQYRDGTCDTTRTVHFGYPTVEQAEAFTRVLQGHMAIETAVFPAGTSGSQLDVLARKALWRDGLNYLHGTGHGVGSFLNVHEGPHSFQSTTPLQPGHVITNEPGYYKDGEFGVRIESALLVREVVTKRQQDEDMWLGFERLTQAPIQLKMVRASMLTKDERQWIKDHNNNVRKTLEPYLAEDKRALKWLRRECQKGFGNEGKGSAGLSIEWD
ncbi:hypothetical protein FS842_000759 [Serendipita sp. 407]|nr:hypothetical protein FS842_000759 [Serendipita sp. 407]